MDRHVITPALAGSHPRRATGSGTSCPTPDPFLLERYGCECWLHYLESQKEFDLDPIMLIQPWHHVKPDVLPSVIAYPLMEAAYRSNAKGHRVCVS